MLVPLLFLFGIEAYYFRKADKENAIDWSLCGEKFGSFIKSNTKDTVHLSSACSIRRNSKIAYWTNIMKNRKITEQLGSSGPLTKHFLDSWFITRNNYGFPLKGNNLISVFDPAKARNP